MFSNEDYGCAFDSFHETCDAASSALGSIADSIAQREEMNFITGTNLQIADTIRNQNELNNSLFRRLFG